MRHTISPKFATFTPWGYAHSVVQIADGIELFSTASHGGYHLSDGRMMEMPEAFRRYWSVNADRNWYNWFEEDCHQCFVVLAFAQFFQSEQLEDAEYTLRNLYPEVWEEFYTRKLAPGESRSRDVKDWLTENSGQLITCVAWGSHAKNVPKGMVGVFAVRNPDSKRSDESYWLVNYDEYKASISKSPYGAMVIDPDKHFYLGCHPDGH